MFISCPFLKIITENVIYTGCSWRYDGYNRRVTFSHPLSVQLTSRGIDNERMVSTGRQSARDGVPYDVTEVWVGSWETSDDCTGRRWLEDRRLWTVSREQR